MKYKYMLFGSLITIIIILTISIILIPFNNETISIQEVDSYSEKITILKNNIKEIEDNKCQTSLNNILKRINETNFKDKVTIKEYYQSYYKDNITFNDLYLEALDKCSIEENDELALNIINQSIFPETIRNRYLLRYELSLKDNISRESLDKILNEKGTFITKTLELNILRQLIEEVQNEENI